MIRKIAHFGDIHIRKCLDRHKEYREVFKETYRILSSQDPDRIIVSGDLFHDFIDTSHEQDILAGEFLTNLSKICKVVITRGNHDFRKKATTRTDSVDHLIKLLNNNNIEYYDETGFFQDENVVWCIHNHGDKILKAKANPWIHNLKTKPVGDNLVYIDLFHDPVYGCKMDNGTVGENVAYTKLTSFKGDYGMFGDIHKFQYLDDRKHYAYCSSLVQQTYGEHPVDHGYLLWDIITDSSEYIRVKNKFNYITLKLNSEDQEIDYSKLNTILDDIHININTKIKIIWKDLASFINLENELKIRKYIEKTFDIKEVIFDKKRIYTNIISSKMLSESIDFNKKEHQQEIFEEYLTGLGYDKREIKEIIRIDDIVNNRLEYKETKKVEWSIDSFWLDNFKSFGDDNMIDWVGRDGIIQINGKNQQGKTTILDGLCYIYFGTTLSTNKIGGGKSEKSGDQRYINNKRELDDCGGGSVITINNEKFTIVRNTNRSWTKKQTVKAAKTEVEYYKGDVIAEEFKLTGETKNRTQKLLDTVLGEFSDFIRLALINADNMNAMLSMTRADFIDSLINDAGYDIFERKLKEFKDYKKTLKSNVKKIDVVEQENSITVCNDNIKTSKLIIEDSSKKLEVIGEDTKKLVSNKDILNKKINVIDHNILNIDIIDIEEKLGRYNDAIRKNIDNQNFNDMKMMELPSSFDESMLDGYYKVINEQNEIILNDKVNVSLLETKISKEGDNQKMVSKTMFDKKKEEKQKNIDKAKEIKVKATEIDNIFKTDLSEKTHDIKTSIMMFDNKLEVKLVEIKSNKDNFKQKKDYKTKVEKSITDLKESELCPTCKKPWEDDKEHQENLENLIQEKQTKIDTLVNEMINYRDNIIPLIVEEAKVIQSEKDVEQYKLSKLEDGDYSSYDDLTEKSNKKNADIAELKETINSLKASNNMIDNNDFSECPELDEFKLDILETINESKERILTIDNQIHKIKSNIKEKSSIINNIESNIMKLEEERGKYNRYNNLLIQNKDLKIELEKYRLAIEKFKEKYNIYENNKKYIIENQQIEEELLDINSKLTMLDYEKEDIKNEENDSERKITLDSHKVSELLDELEIYKEYVKKENLLKTYESCLDRKGIPTYLLKKSIHIINEKMDDLLSDINISAYFNDELTLKMSNREKLDVEINAIEASGAERTLITTALKMALRQINVKSRPNFLFLDEVMGKLVEEKVTEFISLLDKMKKDIQKIIIIEHVHPINFDYIINVTKDDKGVSSFEMF